MSDIGISLLLVAALFLILASILWVGLTVVAVAWLPMEM